MADENDLNMNVGINATQAEAGSKKASAAVKSVTTESKGLEASFRTLKSAIDPTFQATEKYNKLLADAKKLLDAGRISQEEYAQGVRLAKVALDDQIAAITRNAAANKSASDQVKANKASEAQAARAAADAEVAAARQASQQKIEIARQERQKKAALEAQERAAIKLAAQLARQAALEAQRDARPISQRAIGSVAPGSIDTSRSLRQLQNDAQRAMTAAANAAKRAVDFAAAAASAATAKAAQSAQASADKAAAAAESYGARALAIYQTIASVEGSNAERAANEVKAAKEQEKAAARDASAAAIAAAKATKQAEQERAAAAKDSANAVAQQARAERDAAAAADQFRSSIDPIFASQQRFNSTMQRATELLMMGKLREGEWIQILKQAQIQQDVNSRSLGRMNSVSVQLGYQVQDVAASLASGINPLVIFAQQSGQFAYALQNAGGMASRFASILGGVWFQAATAAVIVLSNLFYQTSKAKKATLDLTDAESVRAAKLPDLIQKIKEFNKEQTDSNNIERENLRIKSEALAGDRNQAWRDYQEQLIRVKNLQQQVNEVIAHPPEGDINGAALAGLTFGLSRAEAKLKELKVAWDGFAKSNTELAITAAMKDAEGQVDELARVHTKYDAMIQQATDSSRKQMAIIVSRLAPEKQAAAIAAEKNRLEKVYLDLKRQEKVEEEAIQAAKRAGTGHEMAQYTAPVHGPITSGFGARSAPLKPDGTRGSTNHMGVDIGVPVGTAVHAPQVGVVESIGYSPEMGKYVILSHGGGVTTRYLHLSDTSEITKGQHLDQGQVFAKSGNTGGVAAHLHYEVRVNGKAVDPTKGIFPIDTLKAEQAGMKDLQTAGQKAADAQVAAIDTQSKGIEDNVKLSYEEQYSQLEALEQKRMAIIGKAYGENSKQYEQAKAHELELTKRYNQLVLKEDLDKIKRESQIAQTKANTARDVQSEQTGTKEDRISDKEQEGVISERAAAAERARLLDEEYGNQVAFEDKIYALKLSELQKEMDLPGQTADRIRQINTEIEQMTVEHLGRMEVAQAKYARDVAKVNEQSAQLSLQKWKTVADSLTSSMSSAFQGLWTKSMTVSQALVQMADQLVFKFVDMGLEALNRQMIAFVRNHVLRQGLQTKEVAGVVSGEARKTIAVTTGNRIRHTVVAASAGTEQAVNAATTTSKVASEAIKTGAVTTGATTRGAVNAGAATTEIGQHAATAAAGAYKSTVVIPFIGPVAAPVAAALALATVLGFASLISAEGGMGEVPKDQLAMVHKKEMILPAWIAEPMRKSLSSPKGSGNLMSAVGAAGQVARDHVGGGSGDNLNFHYQPKHTNMGASFETLLRQDSQTMRKWIKNEIRNGSLKLARSQK